MNGVNAGGVNINSLRCADDSVLLTENNTDLQEIIAAVNYIGKPFEMEMNTKN